jgi:hypothetical protein
MSVTQSSSARATFQPRGDEANDNAAVLPWIESPDALPALPRGHIRHVAARLVTVEFAATAAASYLATLAYNLTLFHAWPAAENYVPASIVIALLVSIVGGASRQFEQPHTQPRLKFMWSGVGAVALAFSFFLSMIFFTKFAGLYSRGTFIAQFISVSVAVLAIRAGAYAWLQAAMASGALQVRRVILIGEPNDCTRFTARLRDPGSRIVRALPLVPTATRRDGNDPGDRLARTRSTIEACRADNGDDIIILATKHSLRGAAALAYELSELPVGIHLVDMDAVEVLAAASVVPFGNMMTMQVYHRPVLAVRPVCEALHRHRRRRDRAHHVRAAAADGRPIDQARLAGPRVLSSSAARL